MSIFKESFKPTIRTQIEKRQNAIFNREAKNIQFLNSHNSWVRMTSAVNVNGTSDLAYQYILQDGILNPNGTLKSGLGDFSNAYSNKAADGTPYRLGIRPMPGITSIDVKSKSAYGSLREVTVNFQCWDIKQLEDLELLYMRPGYTVLVEWGWSPYLDNKGDVQSRVDYYNGVLEGKKSKEQIWEDLEKKTEEYFGNYEAMFGYVKNYSWTARMDGGYDCVTNIISLGEILESLKVNYTPADNLPTIIGKGYLSPNIDKTKGTKADIASMNLSGSYSKNILSGLFEELWEIGIQNSEGFLGNATSDVGISIPIYDTKYDYTYDLFHKTININGGSNEATSTKGVGKSDEQIYIALESLTNILNNYVLLRDNNTTTTGAKKPVAQITTKEKGYENVKPNDKIYKDGTGYLLALAHPLQISVDPTVCLIKNNLWTSGLNITLVSSSIDPSEGDPIVKYSNTNYTTLFNQLIDFGVDTFIKAQEDAIVNTVVATTGRQFNEFQELQRQYLELKAILVDRGANSVPAQYSGLKQSFVNYIKDKKFASFYDLLDASLKGEEINRIIVGTNYNNTQKDVQTFQNGKAALSLPPSQAETEKLNQQKQSLEASKTKGTEAIKFLENIKRPYYVDDKWESELGIIGNIYINVNMLYNLANDVNLAGQDKKEKNEIALYDFIKNILSKVSTAIGNVNNFDIFTEPNESVARIIDVNYVDRNKNKDDVYETAFQFEVHNLKSIVRSYKLESKIFPEQSTQIAIGAQVGGGALGVNSTSLTDFNRNITDRVLPIKDAPSNPTSETIPASQKVDTLVQSLLTLYTFFGRLSYNFVVDADFDIDEVNSYANALKDIISFFTSISDTSIKNRAIIPTVLSIEMDGIGGLVIGNIFKIPPEILPKGYKGGDSGAKLGYIVTGLGHSIRRADWVTKIDAQTIILDNPKGTHINFTNLTFSNNEIVVSIPQGGGTNTGKGSINESSAKYPVLTKYYAWKNEYSVDVQKNAKVSAATPIANSLRAALNKQYVTEKGDELSSNGDITPELKNAVLAFQNNLIANKIAFNFITPSNPIVITAGNDTYHRTYGPTRNITTHSRGLAIDIRTSTFNSPQIESIMNLLRSSGFTFVIAHGGTAFHIHANLPTE
jgi:hypothetical protein